MHILDFFILFFGFFIVLGFGLELALADWIIGIMTSIFVYLGKNTYHKWKS